MQLTKYEEDMYNGEYGEGKAECMEILVSLGKIYDAEKMIPITSAQVSGVSYKTIGDAGLDFVVDLGQKADVELETMLNPAGVDIENWEELGFSKEFTDKQIDIIRGYESIGVMSTCTCTPYLIGNTPLLNDHVSWSESSAVCYVNSVIGARSNREGGPSALLAAIVGRTPYYGNHILENRKADMIFDVDYNFTNEAEIGALGYYVGQIVNDKKPYFKLNNSLSRNNLKSLGAALASSGAVSLYHVENVTPEADFAKNHDSFSELEVIDVDESMVKDSIDNLSTTDKIPDLVSLGCPHASITEIQKVASLLKGKKLNKDLWICTSKAIKSISEQCGYLDIIEAAGGKVVSDTCMVVAPIEELDYEVIGVNSAKAANYVPNMCKLDVVYDTVENLIDMIT
ncbi:aconitase X catalytic domain-containing protein [Methanosphaera sp. ISO3-F5]|uniref:aconitase X catalytic domain-containing protein n=1 Tax=Methanosphaera sp. ISO3-F5 TaxID=1452353 RepID=UPI002B261BFC|nr:aconitase X catalytic domain-containing protein [Methanosphaera sp. ISO3-F5]